MTHPERLALNDITRPKEGKSGCGCSVIELAAIAPGFPKCIASTVI